MGGVINGSKCDIIESSLKEFKSNPEEAKVKKQPQSQKKSKSVVRGKNNDKRKKVVKSDKKKSENTESK